MRILGIDPGLQRTGWGIIDHRDGRLSFVACGLIMPDPSLGMAARLADIDAGLSAVIGQYGPAQAAIEETFMNKNAASALKLGQARGAAMVAPARAGLPVAEYAANLVKKSIVGAGHAQKQQMGMMVRLLLPACGQPGADEADALAVAICHAHHMPQLARSRS